MRANRTVTGGTRRGVDGEERDLVDFGSEHGELRVAVEREALMIAGRVLNGTVGAKEGIIRREGNSEGESIAYRDGGI